MSHVVLYAYFDAKGGQELKFVVGIKMTSKFVAINGMKNIDHYISRLFETNDSVLNRSLGEYIRCISDTNYSAQNASLYKVSATFDRSCSMILGLNCSDPDFPVITRYIWGKDRIERAWSSPVCVITNNLPVSIEEDFENTNQDFKKVYEALATPRIDRA